MILLAIQVILKYVFDKKQRMSLERTESTAHCLQSIRGQASAVRLMNGRALQILYDHVLQGA